MNSTVSSEIEQLVRQATPEQQAQIRRFLKGETSSLALGDGQTAARPRFLFEKAGSQWRVVFDGSKEFYIEDTLGARYLDYLLHHPNQPISSFDLEVAVRPEKAAVRSRESFQQKADAKSKRIYLQELERLRGEREEASESGNAGEVDRLDEDIEVLEAEVRGGGGIIDAGERARSNINKALAAVRRRLAKGNQLEVEFCAHIERFVSVGYECLYAQSRGEVWE